MPDQRQQSIKQAGLKSRRAMVWLRDHKLPADPVCYTLAYEYLHSERPKLKQQVDSLNIDDADYLAKIKAVYQQCIIAQDYEKLAMSGDIGNQYVSEILSLLLPAQDKIEDYSGILDAVNLQVGNSPTSDDSRQKTLPANDDTPIQPTGNKDDYLAVAEKASQDELTNALDFDGLKQALVAAIKYPENFPMSLLRINLDRFKQFNDTNGKVMGDAVLKTLVKSMKAQLKGTDLCSRFESDEFIIILPQTVVKNAVPIADKLRNKISTLVLKKKNSSVALKFTVSVGVAQMKSADAFEAALAKSKKALSRSKDLGRNCVNKDD